MATLSVLVTSVVVEDGSIPAPRVGDGAVLRLELTADPRPADLLRISLPVALRPFPRGEVAVAAGHWAYEARAGALRFYWFSDHPLEEQAEAAGGLWHRANGGMVPPDLTPTAGVVTRVRVVAAEVEQDQRGTWIASSAPAFVRREVTEAPTWFAKEAWDEAHRCYVTEFGVVVDLNIDLDNGR